MNESDTFLRSSKATHSFMVIQTVDNGIKSKHKYLLGGPTTMISSLIRNES